MRIEKKQRFTPVTNKEFRCGNIIYHAFRGTTICILRGKNGDMMIDTGLFHVRRSVEKWAKKFNIKYIFITHAHADHDWNARYFAEKYGAKITVMEMAPVDASSTKVRNLVKAGMPITGLVPPGVEEYIIEHKLYR